MTPVEIVARVILWSWAQDVGTEWENYPEIGQHDWNAVVEEIKRLAHEEIPDMDVFARAYDVLAARAEQEAQ